MSLSLLLLVAGTASATTPLPPFERSVALDGDMGVLVDEWDRKFPTIPQRCVRDLVCVGPYDPDIDYTFGNTGVLVHFEDSNTTVGHDPSRHHRYGPYAVTTLIGDDARVCWTGCTLPAGLYAWSYGNATVVVYALGKPITMPTVEWDEAWAYPYGYVPASHCRYSMDGC